MKPLRTKPIWWKVTMAGQDYPLYFFVPGYEQAVMRLEAWCVKRGIERRSAGFTTFVPVP